MNTVPTTKHMHRPYSSGLAFYLFTPSIAWFLHLVAAAIIAEWGCIAGLGGYQFLGISLVSWLLISMSIVSALVAALAVASAGRRKSELSDIERSAESESNSTVYLVELAWLSGWMFMFIIVAQSIPILFFYGGC